MTLSETLYPYQKSFVDANKRFKLFLSSRQIGKSHTIGYELIKSALSHKNGLSICVSTGARAASELLSKAKLYAEAIRISTQSQITYTTSYDSIKFSNGCRVLSLPNNPQALRGTTAQLVAIDEAAFIDHCDEVFAAIAPTLTRDPNSKLIIASTPAGCNGWFYDTYCRALNDDSWYVQVTTIDDAKKSGLNVDIDELHKLVPDIDIFNQEYMCKFSKEFGQFLDFDILDWYDDIPQGKSSYYLGMDIGRYNDKTGISIIRETNDNLYLENVILLSKCEYAKQIQTIKDLHQKYNFTGGYIDEGGIGSAVAEQITKTISSKIKGMTFTGSNKTPMYENVRAKVYDHKLFFNPEFKQLIKDDFRNVHRIVTENGIVKYEAGRDGDGHSDFTSSLVLAVEAQRQMPASFSMPSTYSRQSAFNYKRYF